jgi:hypothetical protein
LAGGTRKTMPIGGHNASWVQEENPQKLKKVISVEWKLAAGMRKTMLIGGHALAGSKKKTLKN